MVDRAPVPDQEVNRLRALFVGLFALVLVAQAAAAAFGGTQSRTSATTSSTKSAPRVAARPATLEGRLALVLRQERKYLGTVRFFEIHPRLLKAGTQRAHAAATLRDARRHLARIEPTVARLRTQIAYRNERRLASMPPRAAICDVFGPYCQQAVSVAWCESRLDTSAVNGQYLGLFQMGETARRVYGHGQSAHEQAVAAHRYFVDSGRDWSPWSCRWAAS